MNPTDHLLPTPYPLPFSLSVCVMRLSRLLVCPCPSSIYIVCTTTCVQDDCQTGSRGCVTATGSSRQTGHGSEEESENESPARTAEGSSSSQLEFEPPCFGESVVPNAKDRATWLPSDLGLCQGERPWHVSIVDVLHVPSILRPGEYVLGFRWDAEETSQVWQSCSDIVVVA